MIYQLLSEEKSEHKPNKISLSSKLINAHYKSLGLYKLHQTLVLLDLILKKASFGLDFLSSFGSATACFSEFLLFTAAKNWHWASEFSRNSFLNTSNDASPVLPLTLYRSGKVPLMICSYSSLIVCKIICLDLLLQVKDVCNATLKPYSSVIFFGGGRGSPLNTV